MHLEATTRRLIVAGLALHQQGKALMEQEHWQDALDLLQHAEEAFNAVPGDVTAGIDNVGLMLLDLVWCAYQLQVRCVRH